MKLEDQLVTLMFFKFTYALFLGISGLLYYKTENLWFISMIIVITGWFILVKTIWEDYKW